MTTSGPSNTHLDPAAGYSSFCTYESNGYGARRTINPNTHHATINWWPTIIVIVIAVIALFAFGII